MNRRAFFHVLGAGLLATPIASVEAQQDGKVARIGYLSVGTPAAGAGLRKAFTEGLRDYGWIEDKNIMIESRYDGAGTTTLDALAAELVRRPLDVVFAVNTPAALATKKTGTKLPVVFATVSEPVAIGLAESLSRPGRNFTGLTTINRAHGQAPGGAQGDHPGLSRVGYLANPSYEAHRAQLTEMNAAAQGLALTLHPIEVRAPAEFEGAFARMAAAHDGAFIVQQDDLFVGNRAVIIEAAAQRRLPGMYVFSLYPRSGGLMSYGASADDLSRRAAGYVDKILKGAKPATLPVERPSKFEFVINLKTAKALGLTISPSLLLRADQVIE